MGWHAEGVTLGLKSTAELRSLSMAKSTKGARNIVVGGVKYHWRATGNDGGISVTVWPQVLPGPLITCGFGYDQTAVPTGGGCYSLTNQVVITNRIVQRVIEYAVAEQGYDPHTKAKQLNLGVMEGKIEMADAVRAS